MSCSVTLVPFGLTCSVTLVPFGRTCSVTLVPSGRTRNWTLVRHVAGHWSSMLQDIAIRFVRLEKRSIMKNFKCIIFIMF